MDTKTDLQRFLCAGGQVHLYKEGARKGYKSSAVFPFGWDYDEERAQRLISVAEDMASTMPHYTPDEVSKQLGITYRAVMELLNMGKLGAIRQGRGYKIFVPAVEAYLGRLKIQKKKEWYDA